jgi:predicted metal-binding protein
MRKLFDIHVSPGPSGFNWEVSLTNGRCVACGFCATEREARAAAQGFVRSVT